MEDIDIWGSSTGSVPLIGPIFYGDSEYGGAVYAGTVSISSSTGGGGGPGGGGSNLIFVLHQQHRKK